MYLNPARLTPDGVFCAKFDKGYKTFNGEKAHGFNSEMKACH